MRNYINLRKNKQSELSQLYPHLLDLVSGDAVLGYKCLFVSVFDHTLSVAEAKDLLENISTEEQNRRDEAIHSLNKKLLKSTKIYRIRFIGKKFNKLRFSKFKDTVKALKYLKPKGLAANGLSFFQLVLPDIKGVYLENFDDTNILYYQEKELLSDFITWVNDVGLNAYE